MRISVVGNARSLLSNKYGNIIDKGDEVIRFNNLKITRPLSQGIKTTILAYSYYRKNMQQYIKRFGTDIKCWCSVEETGLLKEREHLYEVLGTKPSNGITVLEKLKNDYASDHVFIFGFDWKASKTWYHSPRFKEKPDHDYVKEKKYCLELIETMGWRLY